MGPELINSSPVAAVEAWLFAMLGGNPHSALYVSPGHAIYMDGILIPPVIWLMASPGAIAHLIPHLVGHARSHPGGGFGSREFSARPSTCTSSKMQTSMSDCRAHPVTLRHPLRRSSVIVVVAKNWHRICAAPLRPFTIFASRSKDRILDRLARAA